MTGADAIDVSDPRWIVYLIYERPKAGGFAPVGFITVFKFFNPLGRKAPYCKPDQHETRRICQALIFPPYQRQGALCIVWKVVGGGVLYRCG